MMMILLLMHNNQLHKEYMSLHLQRYITQQRTMCK
jgi:hypothetical protein